MDPRMSKGPSAGTVGVLVIRGDTGKLSPNQRIHHRTRSTRIKEWRESAKWIAAELGWPKKPRRVRLDWTIRRWQKTDHFNAMASLALKAAEDGLVDAGIVPDDNEKFVVWGEVSQDCGKQWRYREEIQLTVTVLEELQ